MVMKIQCTIEREGGTEAEIGGTVYHFALDAQGRYVADVTDESHVERFLSIDSAYRAVETDPLDHDGDGRKGGSLPDEDREALVARFEAKFGKKPHHKTSAATIAEKLGDD